MFDEHSAICATRQAVTFTSIVYALVLAFLIVAVVAVGICLLLRSPV
ncbi:MAG TPA: hypothetical protein VFE86_09515 [Ilumatobacteraceae bacterium]|nr:hypothetical protein [Ilumatobacteraceae bacterium]